MVPPAGWLALAALAALLAAAGALPAPPRALACPPGAGARCTYIGGSRNEHQYQVEGKNIIIEHLEGSYITVKCERSSVLESSALPRAVSELRVTKVALSGCPLPAAGSLADTLAALNVTLLLSRDAHGKPLGTLKLTELPHSPPLTERHFLRLENLLILHVSAVTNETVNPKSGFLSPLRSLEVLMMQEVILPPGELDDPPPHLQTLSLKYTGVKQLPEALLISTKLQTLTVASNSALDAVAVPPGLLRLNLWSPATTLQLDAAPALLGLTVSNWVKEKPEPLTQCGNLTSLQLTSPTVRVLPNGWLANCSRLEKLELQYAKNLTSLPEHLLINASGLTLLSFKQCALETLPPNFLDHVPQLRELHLFGNQLQSLPSGLFAVARDVRVLNLSSNELQRSGLAAVAPLEHLAALNLSNNPRITNLCDNNFSKSDISKSTKLTELNLRGTSVNKICYDWRRDMTELRILDLSYTNVSKLWYEDIQFKRTVKDAVVLLKGTPVTLVGMTRPQYNFAMRETTSVAVQIKDLSNLVCDCNMYWTRRALTAPNEPLRHVSGMRCAGGRPLETMKPEEMVCLDNEFYQECAAAAVPAECECGSRPDEDPSISRVRVRVDCAGRGLRRVPRLRTAPDGSQRQYELLLNHNNITELDADVLRPDVIKLDLRNNKLERVSRQTVTKLSRFGGELQLADNPLDCSCSAVPLLRLFSNRGNFTNLKPATCRGGHPLTTAPQLDCVPLATWLACFVAAVLALAVAAVLFLSSRERRFFIKAVLHRWGFSWYVSDSEEDDGRRYDAFVTFSHKDEPTVLELIARLEPTYRLCVHYRDWIPGRYINEQVVESVQDSRRTIALVSRHFLRSGWALAEFRQAHSAAMLEARPRLVVVLLEEPAELELDEQLRRYLATNTYVRWGDPWFWDKLALALPRPRPPVAAPAAGGPRAPREPPAGVRASGASAPRAATAPRASHRPPARVPAPSPRRTSTAPRPERSELASAASIRAPKEPAASAAPTGLPVKRPTRDTRVTIPADASESSPVTSMSATEAMLPPPAGRGRGLQAAPHAVARSPHRPAVAVMT